MPTRIDWMPYKIAERRMLLFNVAEKIDGYAAQLGLTPAEVARIKEISAAFAFAVDITIAAKATAKAMTTWRDSVLSGEPAQAVESPRPMFDNTPAPPGTTVSLIWEFRRIVARIKASSGFSRSMGLDLGIMSPTHAKPVLRELKPVMKVTAVAGFKIKIVCEKKGMTALVIEYRRKGEEKWQKIAFLTKLPETIYIEPAIAGVPETIQVRGSYIKDNKTVGDPSNSAVVTIFGL